MILPVSIDNVYVNRISGVYLPRRRPAWGRTGAQTGRQWTLGNHYHTDRSHTDAIRVRQSVCEMHVRSFDCRIATWSKARQILCRNGRRHRRAVQKKPPCICAGLGPYRCTGGFPVSDEFHFSGLSRLTSGQCAGCGRRSGGSCGRRRRGPPRGPRSPRRRRPCRQTRRE